MSLNIIDFSVLSTAIDEALSGASELQPWRTQVRKPLMRTLLSGWRPTAARRRKADPDWAHRAFDRKERLYRLGDRLPEALDELRKLIDGLCEIARIAGDRRHPMQMGAERFFRSLNHWRPRSSDHWVYSWRFETQMGPLIEKFRERADNAWCRMHKDLPFAVVKEVRAGALIGTRCTTIAEITALGRDARNCLAELHGTHSAFARREQDIWALRVEGRLIAILRTTLIPDPIAVELLGPRNRVGVSGYGQDLVAWLIRAEIKVDRECQIRLVDLLPTSLWAQCLTPG